MPEKTWRDARAAYRAAVLAHALLVVASGAASAQSQPQAPQSTADQELSERDRAKVEQDARTSSRGRSRSSWLEKPATPDGLGIFTQPLGSLFEAAALRAYIPLGVNVPISDRGELVVELTATTGDWYGCDSRSSGGWAAVGFAWFLNARKWLSRGIFLEPKLIGRYFSTRDSRTSAPTLYSTGCYMDDVENIDGRDFELHAGIDFGYSMRVGVVEIAPLIGVSAGLCQNCFGDAVFFSDFEFTDTGYSPPARRKNRLSLGLNLNVARVGVRF